MKSHFSRILVLLTVVSLICATGVLAQGIPMARIVGQVTSEDDQGLPGVSVTFTSPSLQGDRVVVTEAGGNYASPPLPPGVYVVTFDLNGFQPEGRRLRASASQTMTVDQTLRQIEVRDEIVVSGDAIETVSITGTASSTVTFDTLEELPIGRNIADATDLSPGVTGPVAGVTNGNQISGAPTWDNLYTLNGVVLNENIRGQPFNLYIQDAVQEQTTQVGGVSAEYGRFSGGVVEAITKSGGNEFSGSFRVNLDNDDWQSDNRFSPDERPDDVSETYEATFGGRIIRDRLWFFAAGRQFDDPGSTDFSVTGIPFVQGREEDRTEGNLTLGLTPSHQIKGTYIEIDDVQTNIAHGNAVATLSVDDGSIDPERETPQEMFVISYSGVLSDNFFVEANYGEREFTFANGGGEDSAFRASPVWDLALGGIFNESIFCGICREENRDNEQARAKGTYFLSTESGGAHDMAFGYETFTDIRAADNHQSANDWMIWNFAPSIVDGRDVFPVFAPGGTTQLVYLPILNPTQGTDFETQSVFFHDSWRFNDAWSFDLGARYDATDAVNSNGASVADDSAISPRLGASWNPGGDSSWTWHLFAGRYVGAQANGVFDDSSSAGSPATFYFQYDGAPINVGGPLVDTETAVQALFDWLFDACPSLGTIQNPEQPTDPPTSLNPAFDCPALAAADIPGFSNQLDTSLAPVSTDEIKLGFSRPIGSAGTIRADVIRREWNDFFLSRIDTTTGQIELPGGLRTDFGVIENRDDVVEREYLALDIFGNFALLDQRLRLGGTVTLSELEGNFQGETTASGAVSSSILEYPQYKDLRWNAPIGRLGSDQTWKARLWGAYDIFRTAHHRLAVTLLQRFDSGRPFGADGNIDTRPFVDNPGFVTPPPEVTYFFTDRDAFETDDITRTDLSLNYSFTIRGWEIFVQPELLNAFNEDSVTDINDTVLTAQNDPSLQAFNPFTDTPIEGVHWAKGPDFGEPLNEGDLQDTRNWRISVGFRFNP